MGNCLPGTSIRFYGRLGGGGGSLQFRLDGINSNIPLNGTNFNNGPTTVFSADNLGDGDHQLFVYIISLQQNGSVAVDYFEYVIPLLHFVTGNLFRQSYSFQGWESIRTGLRPSLGRTKRDKCTQRGNYCGQYQLGYCVL